jgi:hypothetical protein
LVGVCSACGRLRAGERERRRGVREQQLGAFARPAGDSVPVSDERSQGARGRATHLAVGHAVGRCRTSSRGNGPACRKCWRGGWPRRLALHGGLSGYWGRAARRPGARRKASCEGVVAGCATTAIALGRFVTNGRPMRVSLVKIWPVVRRRCLAFDCIIGLRASHDSHPLRSTAASAVAGMTGRRNCPGRCRRWLSPPGSRWPGQPRGAQDVQAGITMLRRRRMPGTDCAGTGLCGCGRVAQTAIA